MSEAHAANPIPASHFRLLIYGNGSVRTVPLVGERWILGRADDCEITLRDPTVSRRHLLLERDGERILFRDLGGVNPILVEGTPRQDGTFEPGQTLQLGLTRLTLERRSQPVSTITSFDTTLIVSREVIDEELTPPPGGQVTDFANVARRVLERVELACGDLGSAADAAEPLVELAIALTGRRRGTIARFLPDFGIETLASVDALGPCREFRIPEQILREARALARPNLVVATDGGRSVERLVIPLGPGPAAVMVLEEPNPDAPVGQALLRLGRTLGNVIWQRLQETQERQRLRDEVQRLRFHGTSAHQMLLASTRLHDVRQRARQLVNSERTVFLLGEPGTEREDLAHFLHVEGQRAKGPFVALALDAIDASRHETELFGRGEFGGALAAARGGTLFVDAVDRLAPKLQERLIAAANALPSVGHSARLALASSLAPQTSAGPFVASLREAVAAFTLELPPLRADARDILTLAELVLSDLGPNPDGTPRLLGERTKRLLAKHHWPENLAELRRVLEVAASRAGRLPIAPRHLPDYLVEESPQQPAPEVATLDQLEANHIREVLLRVGGNRAKAAQLLGIAVSTLYDKLRRHAIEE